MRVARAGSGATSGPRDLEETPVDRQIVPPVCPGLRTAEGSKNQERCRHDLLHLSPLFHPRVHLRHSRRHHYMQFAELLPLHTSSVCYQRYASDESLTIKACPATPFSDPRRALEPSISHQSSNYRDASSLSASFANFDSSVPSEIQSSKYGASLMSPCRSKAFR